MRINFFSDLHLEFGSQDLPDNGADIIVAAGDIGVSKQGVEWLKKLNKPVIYIAGNHEFYTCEYNQTLIDIREECIDSTVHFLENDVLIYQGVRFLGCSLWADLFSETDEAAEALGKSINDFRKIKYINRLFNQQDFSELYYFSKHWLENELAKPFDGKTIVVTHHAPTEWSWDNSKKRLKKIAYCNDLKHLFHKYAIEAWFHGHIHKPCDYQIAGARILCNPKGYVGRKVVDSFDENKIVEI